MFLCAQSLNSLCALPQLSCPLLSYFPPFPPNTVFPVQLLVCVHAVSSVQVTHLSPCPLGKPCSSFKPWSKWHLLWEIFPGRFIILISGCSPNIWFCLRFYILSAGFSKPQTWLNTFKGKDIRNELIFLTILPLPQFPLKSYIKVKHWVLFCARHQAKCFACSISCKFSIILQCKFSWISTFWRRQSDT